MSLFVPMPSASVSTATAVKPGFFSNWRKANLKSFILFVSGQWSVVRCSSRLWISTFGLLSDFELRISFASQRRHGIDLGRASCRHEACQQRHTEQHERHCPECQRVGGADAEQQIP